MSNLGEKWESMEAALVRENISECVSDVGSEWHKLGGVFMLAVTAAAAAAACACAWACCEGRCSILVFLMISLIISLCCFLRSGCCHQPGRLYSQSTPRCLQARQTGLDSSHFFRRSRHVKQPERERLCILPSPSFLDVRLSEAGPGDVLGDGRMACAVEAMVGF